MKKTLLVAALAAVLMFSVVGSAFAVNESGQQRIGAYDMPVMTPGAPPTLFSGGEGALVNGNKIGTMTYQDWDATQWGNAQTEPSLPNFAGGSPHGNYTTTTVKCVVCHAVHYAAPGEATVASNDQVADTLLRMRADQACVYCHATAGIAVNGRPVYNGVSPTAASTAGENNVGHTTGDNCSVCHTNVHGAGADVRVASLNGYLLNKFTTNGVNGTPAVTTVDIFSAIDALNSKAQSAGFGNALPQSTGAYTTSMTDQTRQEAVGVFCAECHNGAYSTGEAGASTSVRSGVTTDKFTGHRIAAAATATWNATGAVSSGSRTIGTIAWAAANKCVDCHDADDDYGNPSFPHAWGRSLTNSSKMWLGMAPRTGVTPVPVGQASLEDTANAQFQDGVCLKCHVAPSALAGVGITY
ncbi:MAG: hypothetical protein WCJ13_06085 [Coriobacteriia bacterium]